MSDKGSLEIVKEVPFGDYIRFWLQIRHEHDLDTLVRLSDGHERHYLAWELVRKARNPYFENGTGFEGYFVGVCSSPSETLQRLLRVGQDMLTNISRVHRYEYTFKSRMLKTLTEDLDDPRAMSEWDAELGAQLARLRCNLLGNRPADAFHTATYLAVSALPPINYAESEHTIKQRYTIAYVGPDGPRMVVTPGVLKPTEQDAWLVMQLIGKFGHPLVREFVRLNPN